MDRPRVVIEVSGGVADATYADRDVEVLILDHDNQQELEGMGEDYEPAILEPETAPLVVDKLFNLHSPQGGDDEVPDEPHPVDQYEIVSDTGGELERRKG